MLNIKVIGQKDNEFYFYNQLLLTKNIICENKNNNRFDNQVRLIEFKILNGGTLE